MRADGASSMFDNSTPTPGDLSVCLDCTSILTFTDDMALRVATADDLQALPIVTLLKLEALRQLIARRSHDAVRKH